MAHDHNDIYNIVERLRLIEGDLTPTSTKKGLNPQQKSVPQLPALFKPKHISVLNAKTDPKHPMAGYAVGADESAEDNRAVLEAEMAEDVLEKVKSSFHDFIKQAEEQIKDSDIKEKKKEDTDLKKKENKDRALVAKEPKQEVEEASAPVKTMELTDGVMCEIHGDEHSGFEIRHGNRKLKSRFRNLEEAEMAMEMYRARCRSRDMSADYVDEA